MEPKYKFHPEAEIDHFTILDGTIAFYLLVKALYPENTAFRVLDYGAGRGSWFTEEKSKTCRHIRDLRNGASEVIAADIDKAVLENPCSHRQIVIDKENHLPFENESFDVVVADFVFEHINDPSVTANELLRVTCREGWICVRTANRWGYVALFARLIPNALHAKILGIIQPQRHSIDVFPTRYKLCSVGAARKYFPNNKILHVYVFSEPSYHSNKTWLYRILLLLHKLLPAFFAPGLLLFIRK